MKKITLESLIIFIILIWLASWIFIDYKYASFGERGAFGDKFGFINSLFSGLALACIIYSIYLQRKDLKQQRKELKLTRDEFIEQNFHNIFFNLLKNQRDITASLKVRLIDYEGNYKIKFIETDGLSFFRKSKKSLLILKNAMAFSEYEKYQSEDDNYFMNFDHYEEDNIVYYNKRQLFFYFFEQYKISKEEWINYKSLEVLEQNKFIYTKFYYKHNFSYDHYFRHLYHILKIIESYRLELISKVKNKDEIEKINIQAKKYADLTQAQLTIPELFLIYYNLQVFNKPEDLIKRFNFLENLYIEDLIQPHPNTNIILKSKFS